MNKKREMVVGKVVGEVVGFGVAVAVMVYVMPLFAFVTESYGVWLPIGLTTTAINAVSKMVKHVLRMKAGRHLFEAIALGASWYSTFKMREIFPFDFSAVGSAWINEWFRVGLTVVLVLVGIAIAANVVQMFIPDKVEVNEEEGNS